MKSEEWRAKSKGWRVKSEEWRVKSEEMGTGRGELILLVYEESDR